ncbi:MAG: NUDIX domain-containing protein [Flavobacteriales bacterium]
MVTRFNLRVYGIVINDQDEVLISHERRNGFEFTKFPGGGLELGEGILDALKREFLEELAVPVESARLFYVNEFYQSSVFKAEDQIISFYYLVTLNSNKINLMLKNSPIGSLDSSDFECVEWHALTDLIADNMTFPIDKIVVTELKESLLK